MRLSDSTSRLESRRAPSCPKRTQTRASGRSLPLSHHLIAVLSAAKNRHDRHATRLGDAYDPGGYVAANEAGRPYSLSTLNRRWRTVSDAAGVKRIKLHEARHTAGTSMHLKGVPLAVIAAWLGHANASITGAIYAHSQDGALVSAAELLGQLGAASGDTREFRMTRKMTWTPYRSVTHTDAGCGHLKPRRAHGSRFRTCFPSR
ncbi:tyrosine-type recombinase/integrase [Tsukamurella soli]|uniref:Tyr recombinase domain-containing protein n=1 Tax=Tsukamurella soli TaxID=644556 RepID=A0ABP8J1Q7_9ACTN